MLYSALRLLGAKSGRWGAEMWREISPNTSEISQDGKRFAPNGVNSQGISGKRSMQNPWRTWSGCYIQYWSCSEHRVAGEVLRCKGNSTQYGEIAPGGTCLPTQESIPNGFLANRVHRIHGEHVLDVISSTGVAGDKGWPVGC